jgi:hypothetical protein
VVGDQLPHQCERCESPFFFYRRVTYTYVLTEADREFLRSGGISTDDPAASDAGSDQNPGARLN